eukprot:10609408-Alexandrium_andersonii.AAC.1
MRPSRGPSHRTIRHAKFESGERALGSVSARRRSNLDRRRAGSGNRAQVWARGKAACGAQRR